MATRPNAVVQLPGVVEPAGAYSPARRVGNLLQVSGQLGAMAGSGDLAEGLAAQTRQSLNNVQALLEAGGTSWDDVLYVSVFLVDDDDFAEFDAVYAEVVPAPRPARVTVTAVLAPGALVEVAALAVCSA